MFMLCLLLVTLVSFGFFAIHYIHSILFRNNIFCCSIHSCLDIVQTSRPYIYYQDSFQDSPSCVYGDTLISLNKFQFSFSGNSFLLALVHLTKPHCSSIISDLLSPLYIFMQSAILEDISVMTD